MTTSPSFPPSTTTLLPHRKRIGASATGSDSPPPPQTPPAQNQNKQAASNGSPALLPTSHPPSLECMHKTQIFYEFWVMLNSVRLKSKEVCKQRIESNIKKSPNQFLFASGEVNNYTVLVGSILHHLETSHIPLGPVKCLIGT